MRTSAPLLLSLGLLSLSGALCAQDRDGIGTGIEALLRRYHERGAFNGAALVKDGGEVVYEGAFGLADFRDGRPLDVDSAFYLGSVSKQFTAVAVLLLADDGRLSLHDRLARHLPEFGDLAADVTIEQLLTHGSGIPDHLNDLRTDPTGQTNDDVVRLLLEHGELNFEPGSRFSYSNGGYVLLARIVEKVSGQDFAEFMQQRVFTPLGMTRTLVKNRPLEIDDRAVGFDVAGFLDDHLSFTTGAGGMYSTIRDLARWDRMLHEGGLLRAETLRAALSPHREMNPSQSYGYGWMVRREGGETIASHSGGLAGYRTLLMSWLDSGDCIVLLSNQGAAAASGVVRGIADLLAGRPPGGAGRVHVGPYLANVIRDQGLEAALARYDAILADEKESFDLGENELNALGYAFLHAGRTDVAVALHRKNAATFPDSANAYDSLGESLMANGERREAIVNYAKSLALNPDNVAAIDQLQRLRDG